MDNSSYARTRRDLHESLYFPGLRLEPRIPHYYGDFVRKLFLFLAALILVIEPFLARSLPWILPFEIAGAVVLVFLAALTSPTKQMVMVANAFAAAIGMIGFEAIALYSFFSGSVPLFLAREIFAVMCLLALYFSVKTIRAMVLGIIGTRAVTGEFLKRDPRRYTRGLTDSGD